MPRLKRLTIHRLPRVKPGTELVFNEGANVLLGINGSGKTTLLKLLSQVCSGVFAGLEDVDFHVEYELEHEGVSYAVNMRYERPEPTQASALSVLLVIQRPGDAPIQVEVEGHKTSVSYRDRKSELAELPSPFTYPLVSTAIPWTFNAALRGAARVDLRDLFAVDFRPVSRLDESIRWFEESMRLGTFEIHERTSGSRHSSGICTPGSVMSLAVTEFDSSDDRDVLVLQHNALDFLAQSVEVLGHAGATMRLDAVQVTKRSGGILAHTYGRYEFRFLKRDGSRLRPQDLSFGQQRLFAFLYYAAMHPHIVIADELTNGMHHAMIETCLEVVQGRQRFFATQNPLLFDNLGFADADEVRRTFILCSSEVDGDGQEQMDWRNMAVEEAENFYGDYKVGISHVNDILRSWGLW